MNTLIVKLGATGDVVRTTPLLGKLSGRVIWLTESKNRVLLDGVMTKLQCFTWEERSAIPQVEYDLIINLEDTVEVAQFVRGFKSRRLFGAYATADNALRYTDDSRRWFDLSLISAYGREEADRLKLCNRSTYQELIFEGLGYTFQGEAYFLPESSETHLSGDVAIAAEAGPVWPMKNWAYYEELKENLEAEGLTVNVLPRRSSLLQHLADIRNHRCLVGGDSLPMHFALGVGTRCVTLFNCTSPWEIYEYGIQKKIVSPVLEEFFYQRGYDRRATAAITVDEVFTAVMSQLESTVPGSNRIAVK